MTALPHLARAACTALCSLALLGAAAGPAGAALAAAPAIAEPAAGAATAAEGQGADPGEAPGTQEIADALAEDPVYAAPAYASVFTGDQAADLSARIAEYDRPLYVIVVPLIAGDAWGGDRRALAAAVHSRMPDSALDGGAAHYLVSDGSLLGGYDFGPGSEPEGTGPAYYAASAASYQTEYDTPIATGAALAVDILVDEDPEAAHQEAMEEYGSSPYLYGPLPWIAGGAALLLLAGGGVFLAVLLRRRRRAADRRAELRTAPLRTKLANADSAHLDELSRLADDALSTLGMQIAEARPRPGDADAAAALESALEARAAAAKAHEMAGDGIADLADAAGALVLIDLAEFDLQRAVSGRRSGKRPRHCYANPLHGTGTADRDWRALGSARSVRVPLCADCSRAVRNFAAPAALLVEHDGRDVPYYTVPAEQSVWSATGFGTLRSDLVARILRGDLRRTAEQQGD
ncbi:hypothetical protein [Nocardiopsis coralliicola]